MLMNQTLLKQQGKQIPTKKGKKENKGAKEN